MPHPRLYNGSTPEHRTASNIAMAWVPITQSSKPFMTMRQIIKRLLERDSSSYFMKLLPELQLIIAEYLLTRELLYLAQSCHHLHNLLSTVMLRRLAHFTIEPPLNDKRHSTLQIAAATHSVTKLKSLLIACSRVSIRLTTQAVNRPDSTELTPLLSAIVAPKSNQPGSDNDQYLTVQLLLLYGANPEQSCLRTVRRMYGHTNPYYLYYRCQENRWQSPLVYIVLLQQYSIMELLLACGIDVAAPVHPDEFVPLYAAQMRRDTTATKLL
ncbi:hypothetical protein EX30DRAFT_383585 [Ascodesmis nigricans]|uniref:F-box domain-containing protein n=1 Tax=Ascodesmis nigricans TaxID=341454 RepID=A0A4V3SI41_9PEZI|nr:hypothetical protein EX30DRAFT_383585 [Ascodesmis nigricans]